MGQRPQTRLRAASLATQPRLWQVLQRCLAELTVITGEHPERSPAEAAIAYPYWDQYWQEANRHPFGIWFGSSLAGLCLMRRLTDDRWQVAEFCVEAGYRRQGIGTAAIAQATTWCRGRGGVVLEARVLGLPVEALCGKKWVPNRDPARFPVCPTCAELAKGMRGAK